MISLCALIYVLQTPPHPQRMKPEQLGLVYKTRTAFPATRSSLDLHIQFICIYEINSLGKHIAKWTVGAKWRGIWILYNYIEWHRCEKRTCYNNKGTDFPIPSEHCLFNGCDAICTSRSMFRMALKLHVSQLDCCWCLGAFLVPGLLQPLTSALAWRRITL